MIFYVGGGTQVGIKDEPLSPASSHGSDSTDSLSSQVRNMQIDISHQNVPAKCQ